MELISQPFTGQLGNKLIELLDSPNYHTFNIIVAFAKSSGVLRIKDALDRFRQQGGIVNVYVGVDLGGTSYEALTTLILHTDSINVVHSEKGQTFHTKIYQFLGQNQGKMIVGSHNLTGGGLWTNFESSVLISIDETNNHNTQWLKYMDNYFDQLNALENSVMSINTQDDIDSLLEHGYIFKEINEKLQLMQSSSQINRKDKLFGNGTSANIPHISNIVIPHKTTPIDLTPTSFNNSELTIWFESKKLTGGSRNILDLSKRCFLEKGEISGTYLDINEPGFIRGSVEFFDVNPENTDTPRNITLNFEGVDYSNNTILYPVGKNPNGTWRLQIKGISSDGTKITDVFKAKNEGAYLVEKILTFTKIENNYYTLSVFPESELEKFKSISYILARNGRSKTAKQLGFI